MSLTTLELLRQLLVGQQLAVGDPTFTATALAVIEALRELDAAIAEAGAGE